MLVALRVKVTYLFVYYYYDVVQSCKEANTNLSGGVNKQQEAY